VVADGLLITADEYRRLAWGGVEGLNLTWAAERADESLRAAMMAAPRFWTQGIMTSLYQASSLMTSMAG
jgi:hypothetical protein